MVACSAVGRRKVLGIPRKSPVTEMDVSLPAKNIPTKMIVESFMRCSPGAQGIEPWPCDLLEMVADVPSQKPPHWWVEALTSLSGSTTPPSVSPCSGAIHRHQWFIGRVSPNDQALSSHSHQKWIVNTLQPLGPKLNAQKKGSAVLIWVGTI